MPDFRDCTGRKIQIGDVLAQTCVQGGLMLGIVMGFKGKKLIMEEVEVLARDRGNGEITSFSRVRSYWSHRPKHCLVTEIPAGRFGISHPHSTAMFVYASTVASPPVFSRYHSPES